MPAVKNAVDEKFGGEKVIYADPDLAVAKGAAIYARGLVAGNLTPSLTPEHMQRIDDQVKRRLEKRADFKVLTEDEKEKIIKEEKDIELSTTIGANNTLTTIAPPPRVKPVAARSFGPAILVDRATSKMMIDNLIFMGTPTPAENEGDYVTTADNQRQLVVPVYENTVRKNEDKCDTYVELTDTEHEVRYLGELKIDLPNGMRINTPVRFKIIAEPAGITVSATVGEGDSIKSTPITLKSDSVYSEEEAVKVQAKIDKAVVVSDETSIVDKGFEDNISANCDWD